MIDFENYGLPRNGVGGGLSKTSLLILIHIVLNKIMNVIKITKKFRCNILSSFKNLPLIFLINAASWLDNQAH
jgi:hypothetical protein